ncbi:PIN domain-containing protein [Streptomyces sp. BH055]|uniref:PIN domain-containing protein n=1 Tax=Streptomyces sp. BH055 TaxID=3401173 RepID=UPI003BB6EF57
MIIFDTNAVNLLRPEGPTADIIRKLRQSGHHRVAVPWMVLEEMAAHQARFYPDRYQSVLNSLDKLREVLPWELKSSVEALDLERMLDHWREVYGEIFEVIETSDAALRRAYQREAMALPPTKRSKDHSEGGRDAAIWFSILEFLERNPDQHVHFVTNNTSDFGDGTTYPYPMNEDVRDLDRRLTRLKDFAQVVSEFTQEVSGKDAEEAAAKLLASASVRNGVAEAARGMSTLTGYTGLGDGGAPERWYAWSVKPEVDLLAVTDVTGHAIEGDVWYTATAQWLLYGPAVDEMDAAAGYVASSWETKILFSAGDGMAPTLLTSGDPAPPDSDDELCMKILQGLKKRVADISAAAKRRVLADRAPAEQRDRLASAHSGLGLGHMRFAQQVAAQQAALFDGPVQRLARQAAEQMRLVNGPVEQIARQIQANRAALDAVANGPAARLAQQIAAMPRLDIPGDTYQSHSGDDDVEEDEQPGACAPGTQGSEEGGSGLDDNSSE